MITMGAFHFLNWPAVSASLQIKLTCEIGEIKLGF